MSPLVSGDTALLVEPLSADGVGIRLLAGVDPLVDCGLAPRVEPPCADGAGMRLLARVASLGVASLSGTRGASSSSQCT